MVVNLVNPDENNLRKNANEVEDAKTKLHSSESEPRNSADLEQDAVSSHPKEQGNLFSTKAMNEQKSLEGLCILITEDTPVLQRVATIMLEKMGATVTAVGDGLQAVDALNCSVNSDEGRRQSLSKDACTCSQEENWNPSPFDLIMMYCQMPKMDGYEAKKAIRKSEEGTGLHVPSVALTAHAMSSDETKLGLQRNDLEVDWCCSG